MHLSLFNIIIMAHLNIQFEPGEISVVLADDINDLAKHACHVAKQLTDIGLGVQLLNCGMTNRRFWKIARKEVGEKLDNLSTTGALCLKTMIRGNLYAEHETLQTQRESCGTEVIIVCGWEWASKSWKLKEDLIFHLREIAESEEVAVIIYSQARTSPKLGHFDRGGIGKLATMALDINRIDYDEESPKIPAPQIYKPETVADLIREAEANRAALEKEKVVESGELSVNKNNELPMVQLIGLDDDTMEKEEELEEELEFA